MMKRFCIKSRAGKIEYFDILSEGKDGFNVRLTRISDGDEKTSEIFMPRDLFQLCQKTGYIYEVDKAA